MNRYENQVCQISIEDKQQTINAKFYRPNCWSKEEVQEEYDFCFELHEHDFIVVTSSKNTTNSRLFEDKGFRVDIIVENIIILELKSIEKITPTHKKQVLTYLKLSKMKLGYLLNFGEAYLKKGITRLINEKY